MATYSEAIATGARAALCGATNDGVRAQAFLDDVVKATTGLDTNIAGFRQWACSEPPANQPLPPQPPFSGGQCPTAYTATFQVIADSNDQGPNPKSPPSPEVVTAIGPVTVVPAQINPTIRGFKLTNATGTNFSTRYIDSNPVGLRYELSLVRQDGQPDNCGNPPPPAPPPWPPEGEPVPTTITYEGDDGDTYNQDGDYFVFAPSINFNGDLVVPITWAPDVGVSFSGTLNVSTGDITFAPDIFRPGRGGGSPDNTPTPPEPPATNPAPDDDPDVELIRAVVVSMDVSGNNRASEIAYQGQPDTFVPRLGVVRFAIAIPGINGAVWTSDIPIKQTFQWVDCPSAFGAVDVVAAPDPGSGNSILSVTAIRGPSPYLNPD